MAWHSWLTGVDRPDWAREADAQLERAIDKAMNQLGLWGSWLVLRVAALIEPSFARWRGTGLKVTISGLWVTLRWHSAENQEVMVEFTGNSPMELTNLLIDLDWRRLGEMSHEEARKSLAALDPDGEWIRWRAT